MAASKSKKIPDLDGPEHAWSDQTGRYPQDALLRQHGFSILTRPENGEPVWLRNGTQYLESVAHKVVERERVGREA